VALPDEYTLKFEGPLQTTLKSAQEAYERWVDFDGDFFQEDEAAAARDELAVALEVLLGEMQRSGLNVARYLADLEGDFTLVAHQEWFGELLTSDYSTTAGSTSGGVAEGQPEDQLQQLIPVNRRCLQCSGPLSVSAKFCDSCGAETRPLQADELLPLIEKLTADVAALRLVETRARPALPSTNLLSDDFMTRAFAVYGHVLVAGLLISLPIYLLVLLIGLAAN